MLSNKINIDDLVGELKNKIKGEVRFDKGSRALYATDGSNYRQVPVGVVIPRDKDDVIETVKSCHKHQVPLLSRGAGTSLAGQCCNAAVIIDFSKYMNNILEVNPDKKYARVQPGVVLDNLRHETEKYNLTFGPDPATHNHCTLGGMMGNNSCGIHSVMAGKTVDNVIELDILTYDGIRMTVGETTDEQYEAIIKESGRKADIYKRLKKLSDNYAGLIRKRYPDIPRRVSGYNLDDLLPEKNFNVARALIGSESTCIVILEAKLKLVDSPRKRSLLVLGYPDVFSAGDHVPEILKFKPIGLEGIDNLLIDYMTKKGMNIQDTKLLPEGGGWLLVEFGGETKEKADGQAKNCMEALKKGDNPPEMKLYDDEDEEKKVWEIRESGLGATAQVPGNKSTWPGWEDSAIAPEKVGDYLRDLKKLMKKYGYDVSVYGHFGQGCIHCRITFNLRTAEGIKLFKEFVNEAADLVVSYNGSLSGEHGDGQARGPLLIKMYGKELIEAFREYKSIWDPDWKMNPGKVIDAYDIDENLRLGPDYNPPVYDTVFKYPEDNFNFADAALRCVGVGKCRREEGGTMCPSYMATHEEMHSTRGRARLLFEMLNGKELKDGWNSEPVKEALDLCLACKGCKNDCPVNVDMATYKAEFLSHYYGYKARPMAAYSMGLIYWWGKIASKIPGLVNFVMSTPGLNNFAKFAGGIAQQRKIPKFAKQSFRDWYFKRSGRSIDKPSGKPKVILWNDTFNNLFFPRTSLAGKLLLEEAGYEVILPGKNLCCGRPLYDFGMLDLAKKLLQEILAALQGEIEAGIPVVGLEPSCIATFRDELGNMFPNNQDAKRLAQNTYMISEFLSREVKDFNYEKLGRKALVHGHCHHKSIMGMDDENDILSKMDIDYSAPDTGCCGMAGSFGFEKGKYDVSVKCGERVLIPAVNNVGKDTLIIADGFSCREQISQLSGRQAMHFAEVMYLASHNKNASAEEVFNDLNNRLIRER